MDFWSALGCYGFLVGFGFVDSEFDAFHFLPALIFGLGSLGLGLMSASDGFWKHYKDTTWGGTDLGFKLKKLPQEALGPCQKTQNRAIWGCLPV